MKLSIIKPAFIALAGLSTVLTGCLKDKDFDNGATQSFHGGNIKPIEIKLTAGNNTNFLVFAVNNSNNDTTVNLIPVNLATNDPAPEDIKVTLTANATLIADYNNDNQTSYVVPPASMITILNGGVVTIPKGSNTGYLQVKFKPSNFLTGSWAIGYTISSVDKQGYVISGNLQNGIVAILAKNQWDGHYRSAGTFVHPSFPSSWTYADGLTQDFATTGPNSIESLGAFNTLAAQFGIFLDITINPDNSLTEVLNGNPTPTPNTDHYDPATKTFYVSGSYSGGTRRFNGTYQYVGPR